MTAKKVLSVGQCGADHGSLTRVLKTQFDAEVVSADTFDEALGELKGGGYDLVLVNRVFDYDRSSGLDFIGILRDDPSLAQVPVMLVSNYDDAQAQAVAKGALPGFGKAALNHPRTLDRLRAALAGAARPA